MNNKLKELRTKHGLTIRELGRKTNISAQALSFYESGFRSPKFQYAERIAYFFSVPVESIFPQFKRMSPYENNNTNKAV